MPTPEAEAAVSSDLVAAVLRDQHPDLAELTIRHVASGWDNELFRLGNDLAMRLPRRAIAAALIVNEQRWLPRLAPRLPLPVPVPVRVGLPGHGYPWSWSVVPWLSGTTALHAPPDDLATAADELGGFLAAMHTLAPSDAPTNPYRGVPLTDRDRALRDGLTTLDSEVDTEHVRRAWERAAAVEPWQGEPVWLHGDIHPLNLLVDQGSLSAVIDFGDLCAGDPASDFAIGWMLFDDESRARLKQCGGPSGPVDDATWGRARGWALALGVAMANGEEPMRSVGLRALGAALADDPAMG